MRSPADRVTIFGAGHVGATTAFYLALSADLEIALVDVEEGKAIGVALDIGQSLPYAGSGSVVEGGSDPAAVAGSHLVVITAGSPRLPGMSRTDLTSKNAPIVTSIAEKISELAPDAVVVVVTNPVDEMTYLAWRKGGFPSDRVMGMAGILDTSRFLYFLERLGSISPGDAEAIVLGTHGDDMVPLADWSKSGEKPINEVLESEVLGRCIERTRDAGAEIVGHLRTGSAYFAPAVSIGVMALAILDDTGRVLPVSAYLEGQYGIEGMFLGVPARLGRKGVHEILELPLSGEERERLSTAAGGVRKRIAALKAVIGDENA